ncbi:TPA: ankyrin repeat domain-containing protein [Stenotrophomonas maltophilia]
MTNYLLSGASRICAWAATAKKKIADAKHMFQSNRSAREMERALAKLPAGFRLAQAISKGDVGAFKSLIESDTRLAQNHNATGLRSLTINQIVCSDMPDVDPHKEEMILFALEYGADINARLHGDSWTALEAAIYSKNFKIIPFLIKHGARPVDGEADNVLRSENILQEVFTINRSYLAVKNWPLLLEIVDAFASIGLVKNCCNPNQLFIEFIYSDPPSEIFVEVVNRLVESGLKTEEVEFDLCWLFGLLNEKKDDSFDMIVLGNSFIENLAASGFELIDRNNICNINMLSVPTAMLPAIKELISQFSAAKASVQARKEKENILRELAIPSEDIEVRPRRRM